MNFVIQQNAQPAAALPAAGAPGGNVFDSLIEATLSPIDSLLAPPGSTLDKFKWQIIGALAAPAGLPPQVVWGVRSRNFVAFLSQHGDAIVAAVNGLAVEEFGGTNADFTAVDQERLEAILRELENGLGGNVDTITPPMQHRDP